MPNIQKHVAEIPPERPDISQYPSDAGDYCSGRKTWLIQNRLGREKTMAGACRETPAPLWGKDEGQWELTSEAQTQGHAEGQSPDASSVHNRWDNGCCWGSPRSVLLSYPHHITALSNSQKEKLCLCSAS